MAIIDKDNGPNRAEAPRAEHRGQSQTTGGRFFEEQNTHYRNEAPGRLSKENPLYDFIRQDRNVEVTPEINEFLKGLNEVVKTEGRKQIENFEFYQCSNPRSVFVFTGTDANGKKVAILGAFIEMIGSEIPRHAVRSMVLEEAHQTVKRETPDMHIVGYRMYTKSDVVERRDIIRKDIFQSLKFVPDEDIRRITMADLMKGQPTFVTQTRNLKEVQNFFEHRSPNGVLPAMNAGMTISLRQANEHFNGYYGNRRNDFGAQIDTLLAVSVMVDFIALEPTSGARHRMLRNRAPEPLFAPHIRITGIEAVAPLPGFVFWALVFAINHFVYEQGWMQAFYNGNTLAGEPSMLFGNPDPDRQNELFRIDTSHPEAVNDFWASYFDLFGDPIVSLDVELGRKSIPFVYKFAAAADGNGDATDAILKMAEQFFGGRTNFVNDVMSFQGGQAPVASRFSSSHTSIVSTSQRHFDSREITYLSAWQGIVAADPTMESAAILLQPNRFNADVKDQTLRDWASEQAVTFLPVWDTKTVALTEAFTTAIANAVAASNMRVSDIDETGSRQMFQGRNNIGNLGYSGAGVRVYSGPSNGSGFPGQSTWTSFKDLGV